MLSKRSSGVPRIYANEGNFFWVTLLRKVRNQELFKISISSISQETQVTEGELFKTYKDAKLKYPQNLFNYSEQKYEPSNWKSIELIPYAQTNNPTSDSDGTEMKDDNNSMEVSEQSLAILEPASPALFRDSILLNSIHLPISSKVTTVLPVAQPSQILTRSKKIKLNEKSLSVADEEPSQHHTVKRSKRTHSKDTGCSSPITTHCSAQGNSVVAGMLPAFEILHLDNKAIQEHANNGKFASISSPTVSNTEMPGLTSLVPTCSPRCSSNQKVPMLTQFSKSLLQPTIQTAGLTEAVEVEENAPHANPALVFKNIIASKLEDRLKNYRGKRSEDDIAMDNLVFEIKTEAVALNLGPYSLQLFSEASYSLPLDLNRKKAVTPCSWAKTYNKILKTLGNGVTESEVNFLNSLTKLIKPNKRIVKRFDKTLESLLNMSIISMDSVIQWYNSNKETSSEGFQDFITSSFLTFIDAVKNAYKEDKLHQEKENKIAALIDEAVADGLPDDCIELKRSIEFPDEIRKRLPEVRPKGVYNVKKEIAKFYNKKTGICYVETCWENTLEKVNNIFGNTPIAREKLEAKLSECGQILDLNETWQIHAPKETFVKLKLATKFKLRTTDLKITCFFCNVKGLKRIRELPTMKKHLFETHPTALRRLEECSCMESTHNYGSCPNCFCGFKAKDMESKKHHRKCCFYCKFCRMNFGIRQKFMHHVHNDCRFCHDCGEPYTAEESKGKQKLHNTNMKCFRCCVCPTVIHNDQEFYDHLNSCMTSKIID